MDKKIRNKIITLIKKTNWNFNDEIVKIYYEDNVYFLDKSFLKSDFFNEYDRIDFEVASIMGDRKSWSNKYDGGDRIKKDIAKHCGGNDTLLEYQQIWDLNTSICFKRNKDFWYMIDKNGISLNNINIRYFRDFNKGVYIVTKNDKEGSKVIIDGKGQILNDEFTYIDDFTEDVTFAGNQSHFDVVLINTKGEKINDTVYSIHHKNFINGFAQVAIDTEAFKKKHVNKQNWYEYRKYFHINTKGERVTKYDFDEIGDFTEDGIAYVGIKKDYILLKKMKYNFINTNGNIISDVWYDDIIEIFYKGEAKVKKGNNIFYINKQGKKMEYIPDSRKTL